MLERFELKHVPGQATCTIFSLGSDSARHNLPKHPWLCLEPSQVWHFEMGKNFVTISSAAGGAVNNHRSNKKADFCLCWHWRDSCNSKALLQHGNCAACVVHNWVKEASCNSAVDVGDGVVFTYMNMHTCLSVSRVSFGVIRKDNAIVESDRVKCARLLH